MTKFFALVLASCAAALAGEAFAQEQQSLKGLLGRGFEIKSVTFAKGESTDNREAFVDAAEGKISRGLLLSAPGFINLSSAAIDDGKRCDVR